MTSEELYKQSLLSAARMCCAWARELFGDAWEFSPGIMVTRQVSELPPETVRTMPDPDETSIMDRTERVRAYAIELIQHTAQGPRVFLFTDWYSTETGALLRMHYMLAACVLEKSMRELREAGHHEFVDRIAGEISKADSAQLLKLYNLSP